MTADSELLTRAVGEAARLLNADGAMVYLVDHDGDLLRFAHDAGITNPEARRLIHDLTLPVGVGMFGTAVAERKLTVTDDYPADRRFSHSPVADRIVEVAGMRSMAVAPLIADDQPIGALGAYSSRPAAFTEAQVALLRALADHAATAIANDRLLARLAASEERYRNLVEGSPDVIWATDAKGTFTFLSETIRELTGWQPAELLGEHWSAIVTAEDRAPFQRRWQRAQRHGSGERRARFMVARRNGGNVTVEMRGRESLVDGRSAGAHGSIRDITELARLEEGLRTQARELEHRVETQRTLHHIAARITAIRDPDEALQHVVDAAQRLLGSDSAHLTLRDPDQPILRPHVIAGGIDEPTRAWLATQEFPIGGGINGLAAEQGELVWTYDYLVDPRIPHTDDDHDVANRMGLRGMAAAPLRAPGGEIFGTLAVSHQQPRETTDEEVELLQGLADVGAIAIANARLYGQLTESERRYRFIVDNSPDLIWTVDRDGCFTYASETSRPLTGWGPEELVGRHFSEMIAPESLPNVLEHWQRMADEPTVPQQYRLNVLHRDGRQLPMEINGLGTVVDGEFAGGHGSIRDLRERVQLEDDLRRQAAELERVVEVQRTLGEIARSIVEVDDSAETLQQVVDASKRLLGSDGAHLTLLNDEGTDLIPMVMAGDTDPETRAWLRTRRFPVGGGINGLAASTGQPVWTDDYLADPRIPHDPDDESPARLELGAVAVAPLRGSGGEVVGTLAITYRQPREVEMQDVALLEELAGQGAIAARNAGLYAQLRERAEQLERSAEAQATLAAIAAEISSIRDPVAVLRRTVEAAKRLLQADHAVINQMQPASGLLWDLSPEDLAPVPGSELPSGVGVAGAAITEARVRWTGDYLEDQGFKHLPEADAWIRERGYRSQMSAPLIQEDAPMGTLTVHSAKPDAFGASDAELLGALASHAAIVQTNARLFAEARASAEELAHLVEAQRSLSAIATQITSIRDPAVVLQRTVDEAFRLLNADLALVNPLSGSGRELELPVAHAPSAIQLDDVVLTPGEGVSGTALAERRVVRTGDYLNDTSFTHSPAADDYIRDRSVASVMSAPLIAGDRPLGVLSVQAERRDAFSDDDAQLLDALAAQAAVAITNARLLEQLQESERRYRHLVDHSPDLVWSVDAEGRFTYLGESLERMTGFSSEELLGRHWEALASPESLDAARAAWQAVQERPEEDLQFRVMLPLAGGSAMAAEVNMVATLVDGRFAGAQGSIRDIRERERLEQDLRRQAAAIAANEERANLARELHDSVTQALFSMGLTARALELVMERDPVAARDKITELRELQKDALAEMRTLIFELRPQALETDGLAQALRNHGAAVQGRTGLSVSVEVEAEERLPIDIEEALYRVAQEALHNVVKHANASHASIRLRRAGRELRLTIEDDGIGFDPAAAPRGHLGVVGMRQRVERIGAELAINRRPGGGTRVRATLPLDGISPRPAAAAASVK